MATERSDIGDADFHERLLARHMADPGFRAEYEHQRAQIVAIDEIVGSLERLRAELGLSKAQLARMIGKNEASIRRLLTAPVNPELRTVVALADALGADLRVVARAEVAGPK